MLILTGKPGEKVSLGNGLTLTVVEVIGNRVRFGIDAPDQVPVLRADPAGGPGKPVRSDQPAEPEFVCDW